MAARLAFPDAPVILLSGDGSITFALAELESAVHQGIPFVAIVADDQAWGIVACGQLKRRGCTAASQMGAIDFAKVAEGLGARGRRIDRAEDIAPAVCDALASDQPTLIHIPVSLGGPADFAS